MPEGMHGGWQTSGTVSRVTAATGQNVDTAVDAALGLYGQAQTRVTTARLNSALEEILVRRGPSPKRGTKPVKIYYATQVGVAPPTVVFFCNDPGLVRDDYRRYMQNRLRELTPFREVPLRLWFRASGADRRA
jgi:GTP-binding protein